MIFDGRWKWELKKQSWAISLWQKAPSYGEYGKYKLNRAVLYSATVLRKAIEDEIEAEKVAKEQNWTLPECKIMSVTSATKYPYTDEDGWAFRGKICVSSYGEGQAASLKVKDVCNWLLHSYVWGVAGYADQKGFAGFLVASDFDKEKFVHFVSFDEWQKVIDAAIKKVVSRFMCKFDSGIWQKSITGGLRRPLVTFGRPGRKGSRAAAACLALDASRADCHSPDQQVLLDDLEVLHVHVFLAAPLGARHMAQPRADQHQGGVAVRECPHHPRPSADLTVQPLDHVVGTDAGPVFAGKIAV